MEAPVAPGLDGLDRAVDEVAATTGFAGVVRVDLPGEPVLERAYGLADRPHGVPHAVDTMIGVASGAKVFTALTVLRLVEEGDLALDTPARELLGADLPLVDDAVTVEHLLSHRSGIGDYLDEDELDDATAYLMPVPVHRLDSAESYLAVLDGLPQKFPPGTGFSYCNGGYCVLALLAERAAGEPFHDLVRRHVIGRAGLRRTAYLRSDELPGDAATGYLGEGPRTNVLHLPVVGGGDGGIFTTAADVRRLWVAIDDGLVVSGPVREAMYRSRSVLGAQGGDQGDEKVGDDGYGLGVWRSGAAVALEGADAGASFRSVHVPGRATWSVLSNTTEGAWPVASRLAGLITGGGPSR
ncbi:serine hydrolase domain-containing protein [Nocardioides sp. GCM10027113]|uniref:serine hydrolase domain-containing protein n=1 Tax=unclassified Nocardioides TaxID=2615069 RepID=UPI003620524E